MNPISVGKYVPLHLWIPSSFLVTEMNPGLQQRLHGYRFTDLLLICFDLNSLFDHISSFSLTSCLATYEAQYF